MYDAPRGLPDDAIRRFARGAAHDFSNVLLLIRGYVELALEEKDLGPKARGHIEEVLLALGRVSELVRDLRAVGRRSPSPAEKFDLNAVIDRILGRRRAAGRPGVTVDFAAGAGLPPLSGSTDQVDRGIAALVSFIVERTPEGSAVSIQTSRAATGSTAGSGIVLRLTSDAAVVHEDERAHLFEPFYVSPTTGRHLGIGLAAAQGAVSLLNGEIHLGVPPSGGVELVITLPAPRDVAGTPPASADESIVLLADDDERLRESVSRALAREGFRVRAVADGAEALALVEESREAIRIAILDDVMPKASGRTVLESIRRTLPSLPVILCAEYTWDGQESAARLGVEEILAKPYAPRDLLRCVRRVLGSRG